MLRAFAFAEFQGDHPALNAAYTEIKSQFMLHSNAADTQVPQLVEAGREAAAFLNEAVVQAKLNDRGAYGANLTALTAGLPLLDNSRHQRKIAPSHIILFCRGGKPSRRQSRQFNYTR